MARVIREKALPFLYNLLFFLAPLVFFPKSSEVFEFNKMLLIYAFTAVICAVWIVKMVLERRIILRRTALDIPLILFFLTQVVSTVISIDPRTSFFGYYSRFHGGLMSTVSYLLLYWAFVSNVEKKCLRGIKSSILASAAVVSIWGILEHFGRSPSCLFIKNDSGNYTFGVDCWVQDVKTRVFATIGQPNWMAAYLAALIPLTWSFALNSKFEIRNSKFILLFVLFFTALEFTKSRSGILGFAISAIIFFGLTLVKEITSKNIKVFTKKLPIFFTIGLITAILGVAIDTPWKPNMPWGKEAKTAPISDAPALEQGGTESGEIRRIVWKGAVNLFKKYPIFGSGVETFAFSYYETRPMEHNLVSEWDFLYNKAHNEYLNFLSTTGVLGTLSYISVIVVSLYILRKNAALLAGYAAILVTNFFGFSVTSVALLFFLFPAMSAVQAVRSSKFEVQSKKLNKIQITIVILVLCTMYYVLSQIATYWLADYNYSMGIKYQKKEDFSSSSIYLGRALELRPHEPLYHVELAQTYSKAAILMSEQKLEDAQKIAELAGSEAHSAASVSPRNIVIAKKQANVLEDLIEVNPIYLPELIDTLENLTKNAPTDAKVFNRLARAYIYQGDIKKAVETLEKTILLKPDYTLAREQLEKIQNTP